MKERELVEQGLLCQNCGKKYDSHKVLYWKTMKPAVVGKTCPDCHRKKNEASSVRMKERNPMKDGRTANKMSRTIRRNNATRDPVVLTDEHRQKISEAQKRFNASKEGKRCRRKKSGLMTANNPMHDDAVVEKKKDTWKVNKASGKYTFPTGKDHWLWKGNRNFNLYVRSNLYRPWIFEVLKRDDFTCTRCEQKSGVVHVHHLRPLRDIIEITLGVEGVDPTALEDVKDEWPRLADQVVKEHRLEDGTTLCPKCHEIVDKHYRKRKQ